MRVVQPAEEVYTALVKENPPRSRSGSRDCARLRGLQRRVEGLADGASKRGRHERLLNEAGVQVVPMLRGLGSARVSGRKDNLDVRPDCPEPGHELTPMIGMTTSCSLSETKSIPRMGVIAKTEGEYKITVVRLLGDMRRNGEIEFDWIAGNTRWMRKPRTFSSLENMLKRTAEAYRRSVWDNQECYVEIWLEKDALAGVLYEETGAWDVPLMVTRGTLRFHSCTGRLN
jgi:hypothetical protein